MNIMSPKETALKFVEQINSQNLDGLVQLMTEDHRFVDYEGEADHGREVMRDGFGRYFSAYPEYKIHISKVCTSGDAVAIIGKTTGSHLLPEVDAEEILIWTAKIQNGLIAEWRIYMDLENVRKIAE